MPTARPGLVALALLAACGGGHGSPIDAAPSIDAPAAVDAGIDAAAGGYVRQPPVSIPPAPPPQDVSHLPRDEQGRPILAEGADYYLVERPPDPLTARSDCAAMIVRCVDPAVQGRTLDACVISPPRCMTDQPWLEATPCCPSACIDRYEQLRVAGTAPIDAFDRALYGRPSCAPGVAALVGGAP